MRLIDAKAMEKQVKKFCKNIPFIGDGFLRLIRSQPTIDAEIVRHGHWEEIIDDYKHPAVGSTVRCSQCWRREKVGWHMESAEKRAAELYPYCHCGAKMDKEVKYVEND